MADRRGRQVREPADAAKASPPLQPRVNGSAPEESRPGERTSKQAEQSKQRPERTVDVPEQTVEARDDLAESSDESLLLIDENPDTLVDQRRSDGHPEQFGRPGRPLGRNSPFYVGFVGALGVLLAYVLAQAVASAASVLVLIIISMFFAVGLNPVVEWLIHSGMRRGLAVGSVFLATILAFVGFGAIIVPPVAQQSQQLVSLLPDMLNRLLSSETVRDLNDRYQVIDNARSYVSAGNLSTLAFGGLLGFGKIVVSAVFSALTILILTLYFLASLPTIKREIYRLVPASRRERVALLGDEILLRIGGYVSGAFTVASIAGVAVYAFLLVLGIPYPHALALFAGFMSLVPMVGATMAMVVVTTAGLFHSIPAGIAIAIYYVVYQQIENYVIYPRVMRRSVDVPAAVTIIAALLGGALGGLVGALLAIPMAAAVLLLVREVLIPRMDRT